MEPTTTFAADHPRTHAAALALADGATDEGVVREHVSSLTLAEASAAPEDGISLLMLCAAAGHMSCCRVLIELGVPLDARDAFGCDALFYAVRHQQVDIVDSLLVARAPTDAFGKAGGSSLIEAATLGDARLCSLLCAAGADVNALDAFGFNAVQAALRTSRWEVLLVLGAWGTTWSRGHMASAEGGWHRIQSAGALEAGRSAFLLGVVGASNASLPLLADAMGATPLHACAERNWPDGVRFLLHARANLRARDSLGRDACHCAALKGHDRVVRILLLNGNSPRHAAKGGDRRTALMAAAAGSSVRSIFLLWEANADIAATDAAGDTALRIAIQEGGSAGVVALLAGLRRLRPRRGGHIFPIGAHKVIGLAAL